MGRTFATLQADLAANLKERRLLEGLSQEALALAADVDRTYVSQIERCVGNPSLQILAKLARSLDLDVAALLDASLPHSAKKDPQ